MGEVRINHLVENVIGAEPHKISEPVHHYKRYLLIIEICIFKDL